MGEGLVKALPELISELPAIIDAMVNFLVKSSPQLSLAGFTLLVALIANLPAIIVELLKAVPQIVQSLINGFNSYISSFIEVGASIVRGIWQGITQAGAWLSEKISGFVSGIINGVKSMLGIQSPSTVFADIGRDMGEGIGIGFEDAMSRVGRDMKNAIPANVDAGYSTERYKPGTSITQNISVVTPKALSEKELARELKNLSRKLAMEY